MDLTETSPEATDAGDRVDRAGGIGVVFGCYNTWCVPVLSVKSK